MIKEKKYVALYEIQKDDCCFMYLLNLIYIIKTGYNLMEINERKIK